MKINPNSNKSLALQIIENVFPLNRQFSHPEYKIAANLVCENLPFKNYDFQNADEVLGWRIPPSVVVKKAEIRSAEYLIYDGTSHPLAVIAGTTSVNDKVSGSDLKKHLHFHPVRHQDIPWHFRQMYQPWKRTWGFCVPKAIYDSIKDTQTYEVSIKTEESKGNLQVLEYTKKGKYDLNFIFCSHLDHPCMANDDLSGAALGIELFKWIEAQNTNFTYTLLIVPEIIGTELYLQKTKKKFHEGLFLESLGSSGNLKLQASYHSNSSIEQVLKNITKNMDTKLEHYGFREIAENDEIVFEAHGIPMSSLTRHPFVEHHSSADNLSIIKQKSLDEVIKLLKKLVTEIEKKTFVKKIFEGYPCLSNPDYDLYISGIQRAFPELDDNKRHDLRKVMDLISVMEHFTPLERILQPVGTHSKDVLKYLRKCEKKNLIEIIN